MSSRPFIVLGDRTSHGGTVVEASQVTFTHNRPIARVGDQVTCPIPGHGTTVIVEGDPTMILDGKPVARHGDKCACGAVLISSQVVSTVGDGGGGASSPQAASQAQREKAAQAGVASSSTQSGASNNTAADSKSHAIRFQALDPESGKPVPECDYVLTRENGALQNGVTDPEGFTEQIEAEHPELIDVHFVFKSPKGENIKQEDLAA